MDQPSLSKTARALIDIAWHFGTSGPNEDCCAGLSIPEFLALEKVSTTVDCPVHTIGTELGFTKSGATRVVNRLESKDLVQRVKSPADGRVCCVQITNQGKEVLLAANDLYNTEFQQVRAQMPAELKTDAAAVVQALAKGLKLLPSHSGKP